MTDQSQDPSGTKPKTLNLADKIMLGGALTGVATILGGVAYPSVRDLADLGKDQSAATSINNDMDGFGIAMAGLGLVLVSLAGFSVSGKVDRIKDEREKEIQLIQTLTSPVEGAPTFNALDPSVRRTIRERLVAAMNDFLLVDKMTHKEFDISDLKNLAKVVEAWAVAIDTHVAVLPKPPARGR